MVSEDSVSQTVYSINWLKSVLSITPSQSNRTIGKCNERRIQEETCARRGEWYRKWMPGMMGSAWHNIASMTQSAMDPCAQLRKSKRVGVGPVPEKDMHIV